MDQIVTLIATKAVIYNGKRYQPGEEFQAIRKYARVLIALGKVSLVEDSENAAPATPATPEQTPAAPVTEAAEATEASETVLTEAGEGESAEVSEGEQADQTAEAGEATEAEATEAQPDNVDTPSTPAASDNDGTVAPQADGKVRRMTEKAEGATYESFISVGWSDEQLVAEGYMVIDSEQAEEAQPKKAKAKKAK